MTSRKRQFHGIVLKIRPFNEQDAFVTFLTEEKGKVHCLAKGLRNIKSRRANHVELLSYLSVECWKSLHHTYLTQASTEKRFEALKKDWDSLSSGTFVVEFLERVLEEETAHPELFHLTLQTMHTMNEHPEHHALLRELFLLKSLSLLGILSSFRTCSQCREPLPLQTAYFDENHLTVHCEHCLRQAKAGAEWVSRGQAKAGRNIFSPQELPLASLKLLHSIGRDSLDQLLKIKLETSHHELLWSMGRRFLRQALNTPLNSEAFLKI